MMREKMIVALTDAVRSKNYTLYTGVEYRINEQIKMLPAAWLIPPKLIRIEGRNHGMATYAVAMHLMTGGKYLSEDQKFVAWSTLEQDAIAIHNMLNSHANITSATDLQCLPAEFTLSNHGEISVGVSFNIQIGFCS